MPRRTNRPADSDAVGLRTGRSAPTKTDIHDWVMYSGISPIAIALYVILRSHVNRERGDDLVWTSSLTLAVLLGDYSRGDKIKPYMDELVALKAIERERTGLHGRNQYLVHQLPPDGYTGPLNGKEWYARNKKDLEAKRAAEKVARDARRSKQKAQKNTRSSLVNPVSGEQAPTPSVHPDSGEPVPLNRGEPVHPDSGREPRRGLEPAGNEPPPPAGSSGPPPAWAVEPEQEQIPFPEQTPTPADAGAGLTAWERSLHADVMAERPSWSPSLLAEVIADRRIRERPDRDLVRRAFLIGARHRNTVPRRMLHDNCPHWETAFQEIRAAAAEAGRSAADAERPATPDARPTAAAPTAAYLEARQQLAGKRPPAARIGGSTPQRAGAAS